MSIRDNPEYTRLLTGLSESKQQPNPVSLPDHYILSEILAKPDGAYLFAGRTAKALSVSPDYIQGLIRRKILSGRYVESPGQRYGRGWHVRMDSIFRIYAIYLAAKALLQDHKNDVAIDEPGNIEQRADRLLEKIKDSLTESD